jgi:hypothetical protein
MTYVRRLSLEETCVRPLSLEGTYGRRLALGRNVSVPGKGEGNLHCHCGRHANEQNKDCYQEANKLFHHHSTLIMVLGL